jgi:hypothetical protein
VRGFSRNLDFSCCLGVKQRNEQEEEQYALHGRGL